VNICFQPIRRQIHPTHGSPHRTRPEPFRSFSSNGPDSPASPSSIHGQIFFAPVKSEIWRYVLPARANLIHRNPSPSPTPSAPPPSSLLTFSTAAGVDLGQLRPLPVPPTSPQSPLSLLCVFHILEPPNRTSNRNPSPGSWLYREEQEVHDDVRHLCSLQRMVVPRK
jgi:hypothetical protein